MAKEKMDPKLFAALEDHGKKWMGHPCIARYTPNSSTLVLVFRSDDGPTTPHRYYMATLFTIGSTPTISVDAESEYPADIFAALEMRINE